MSEEIPSEKLQTVLDFVKPVLEDEKYIGGRIIVVALERDELKDLQKDLSERLSVGITIWNTSTPWDEKTQEFSRLVLVCLRDMINLTLPFPVAAMILCRGIITDPKERMVSELTDISPGFDGTKISLSPAATAILGSEGGSIKIKEPETTPTNYFNLITPYNAPTNVPNDVVVYYYREQTSDEPSGCVNYSQLRKTDDLRP